MECYSYFLNRISAVYYIFINKSTIKLRLGQESSCVDCKDLLHPHLLQVPEVMEYVTEKADLYELNKKVKSWERKVDIAEVYFS